METVDALDRTFQHASRIIAAVRPEQYDQRTPCTEWTVRDVLEHMIGVVEGLGSAAAGTPPGEFSLAADPGAQFDEAARSALQAWRREGTLDKEIEIAAGSMPGRVVAEINLLDTATHAWDLATATGQPATLPDDVASAALDASRSIVSPELRPGRFAPEVDAPPSADKTQQLVSFLGRTP